ncbi:unnamed protein product [Heterobilharzia americana]|nr:unnamed protein product [Heterobilharzia americana]
MNLTLKGSQISLNKSNSNSGRSSARTYNANYRTGNVTQNNGNHEVSSYDPEVLSNSSLPSVKQKLKLLNNLFNKDDNGIHIDLNEANSTNPIIIPQKNDGNSFSSNQNDSSVSDWLETHFLCQNNSNLKWGKIKADCVTRSETRNADLKAERNDNITDDSLDLEMGADFSNVAMDLKKITDEDSDIYCIDINEKTDTPPPCLVRPSSNSINTSRQISSPQDETDQTSGRRRHLAAEAAMRRLLEDQKRRLNEENLNSRGQPIQSVLQNRQNELKQRRKKQHQNAIKVLHENRSINGLKRRDSIKDEQSVNTMIKSDTLTDKQEECKDINESNILKKPTSPIKLNQNKSWNPSDSFSENPQQNKCTTDESASVGNYSDNLIDSAKLQVEKTQRRKSTVDDILHELKQLEKVDDLTYHSICSQDVRTTTEKQIPLKKSSTPNTWSEMVKDINRVLSEAEQDELQLDCSRKYCDSSRSVVVDGIRSRSDSILSNHSSLLHSNSLGPPTTVTNNYSYLTKENLRSHTKQMEHVDFRQKAQKELDQSISQLNQTLTEERASLEANRRRLMSEISDERERLALIATKQREEMDTLRHNLESALAEANEQHKMEIQQLRADLSQRHKDEITELNQRNLAERAAWEDHTKDCAKRKTQEDRDRLLESAIHRLEAEANEARLETDRQTELKIKRVREKFQAEIEELESSCIIRETKQERQNISDVIRQEFADRLVFVEEENRSVKRELAECKARIKAEQERHEKEIDAIKKSNNSEIETVHQKVKEVIKKKDEKLVMLRENFHSELEKKDRELEAVNQRAQHLEELIDQQRKQFLQSNH